MKQKEAILYMTKLVWKFGKKRLMLLYVVMFLCAHIIWFFEPLIIAKVINIITDQGVTTQNLSTILSLVFMYIAIVIGFWAFHGPARLIERINAFHIFTNYKQHLFEGVLNLPLKWHNDEHSGDIIDKIEKGALSLYEYAGDTFMVIEALSLLITSYVAIAYFNLHAAYIVPACVFLAIVTTLQFDKRLRKQYKQLFKMHNKISAKVFDTISNITTVVILKLEKLLAKDLYKAMLTPFTLFKKNNKLNEVKWFFVSLIDGIMVVSVLTSFILFNYNQQLPIVVGTLAALYQYLRRISNQFFRFAWKYGEIVTQQAAVENAQELVSQFTKTKKQHKQHSQKWKQIRIKNMNFSYQSEDETAHVKDINIAFKKAEKIALIGESGSGKTTFLKLLANLYEANHQGVFIDGKQATLQSLSNQVTLLPQEPELFATTVKHNITLGLRHTLHTIKKYTDLARFTQVIKRLPNGLDSSIVEKGVNLSGGEKQRLALARGLLAAKDKQIILLDEPTSSVDPKNERLIYQGILKEFKGKTIFSAMHRLHLLPLFDTIYVFSKGKLVAHGSLKELKKNKFFLELWKKYQH